MTLQQLAPWARFIVYGAIGVGALIGGVTATLIVDACRAYSRSPE